MLQTCEPCTVALGTSKPSRDHSFHTKGKPDTPTAASPPYSLYPDAAAHSPACTATQASDSFAGQRTSPKAAPASSAERQGQRAMPYKWRIRLLDLKRSAVQVRGRRELGYGFPRHAVLRIRRPLLCRRDTRRSTPSSPPDSLEMDDVGGVGLQCGRRGRRVKSMQDANEQQPGWQQRRHCPCCAQSQPTLGALDDPLTRPSSACSLPYQTRHTRKPKLPVCCHTQRGCWRRWSSGCRRPACRHSARVQRSGAGNAWPPILSNHQETCHDGPSAACSCAAAAL